MHLVDRPDRRTFFIFRGDLDALGHMLTVVRSEVPGPLHASGQQSDAALLDRLKASGFVDEMTSEAFNVRFDVVLPRLRRAWVPEGFRIATANEASRTKLLELDNALRNLIPGLDGWECTVADFEAEFEDTPPYAPAAYLVAIAPDDTYGALVRIWRNPTGPRIGMVGVLPQYRHLPLAAKLLHRALTEASTWGSETFVTETAHTNTALHPRLVRHAEASVDVLYQLVLR